MCGSRGVLDVPSQCLHAFGYVWDIDHGEIPSTLETDEITGTFHNAPGAVLVAWP
jgi:hypothetical protein